MDQMAGSVECTMDDDVVNRTCIVTRDVCEPSQLIRFVAGPDGGVVPDLKRKLPGRGVWVKARRSVVDLAIEKSAFARGLKTNAKADQDLANRVDDLICEAALGALGFARKAGQCITGSGKVEGSIRAGRDLAILHASDGADDGLRKLSQAVHAVQRDGGRKMNIWRVFSSEQMNMALGATNVIHAALMNGSAGQNCRHRVMQLAEYREMEPS